MVLPESSGSALTSVTSSKLSQTVCAAEWHFHIVSRDMETIYLKPNTTLGFTFPRNDCIRLAHYTACSVRIVSASEDHYPHIRIRSLYLDQGYNTHTCDHAAVVFAAMSRLVKHRAHSPAVLCHKYITMSERGWKMRLPFDEYSGGNYVRTNGNYIEITYFAYLLHWQLVSQSGMLNHLTFDASVSTCFAFYLNCYIPKEGLRKGAALESGKEDVTNLKPVLASKLLQADYLQGPYPQNPTDKNYLLLVSDTVDGYRYLTIDKIVMTNVHVKRGKVCVTIQKYPTLVPGTQRQCGYTLLKDIGSSVYYSSKEIVKHHGHNCVKINTDTERLKVQQYTWGADKLIDVNSFVVRGHCVFQHTLRSMDYTHKPLTETTPPYIGSYWLQNLNYVFSSKDQFWNGSQMVAHYTIPALITAVALTNMDRSIIQHTQRTSKFNFCILSYR